MTQYCHNILYTDIVKTFCGMEICTFSRYVHIRILKEITYECKHEAYISLSKSQSRKFRI